MKKLLICVLSLLLVETGLYAYTCDLYSTTYAAAAAAVKAHKVALCGAEKYYDSGACTAATPEGDIGGGLWGKFKKNCFMEKDPGSCMSYDSGKAEYKFLCRSTTLTPPPLLTCNDIACVKHNGLEKMQKTFGKGCDDAMKSGMELDTETVILLLLTGGTAASTYYIDDIIKKEDKDSSSNALCRSYCTTFWSEVEAIKKAQEALDNIDKEKLCPCDDQCICTNDTKGAWVNNACICDGLLGTAELDQCVCTKKTPAGVWFKGKCYPKGSGNNPTYGDDEGSNGSTSGTGNTNSSSSGTGDSGSGSSSGGTSSAGLGSGQEGGAAGTPGSGKTWANQLRDTLGISSTSSGAAKLAGSKGTAPLAGLGNSGGKKKDSTLGVASSDNDIFALVSAGYVRNQNGLLESDANSSVKSSSVEGTKPIIYK